MAVGWSVRKGVGVAQSRSGGWLVGAGAAKSTMYFHQLSHSTLFFIIRLRQSWEHSIEVTMADASPLSRPFGLTVRSAPLLAAVLLVGRQLTAHHVSSHRSFAHNSPIPPSQENMDETLGMQTSDLYASMLQTQTDYVSPQSYSPTSSYIPYRRYLVDWMSDVGEQCSLHTSTVHCGILYLDKIFREREVPRESWQLLATACLSVAAKVC